MNRSELFRSLMDHFNIEELGELYFHLSLDREALAGANPTKRNLVISLIETCQRQEQMPALLAQCQQLRPQVFPTDMDYVAAPAVPPIPEQARGCYVFLGRFKFALVLSLPVFFFVSLYGLVSPIFPILVGSIVSYETVPAAYPPHTPPLILRTGWYALRYGLIYGGLTGLIQWQVLRWNGLRVRSKTTPSSRRFRTSGRIHSNSKVINEQTLRAKWGLLVAVNIAALLAGKFLASIPYVGELVLAAPIIAVIQWRFFWREISDQKWTAVLAGLTFSFSGWIGLLVTAAILAWLVFSPRMNKTRLTFILTLPFIFMAAAFLLLADYAEIAFISQTDAILVAENETIKGDLFNLGDATIKDGATIDGDVVLMGGSLNLGKVIVTGNVVLIGDGRLNMSEESVIQGRCFAYQIQQSSIESNQAACQKGLILPLSTAWMVIVQLVRLHWGMWLFLFGLGTAWIFLLFSPQAKLYY